MMERLARPNGIDSPRMWVDEAIWGHRLYDEQTPWLCMMEFLNVLQSEYKDGRAFQEISYNTLRYAAHSRMYLRNILFNNPQMQIIENDFSNDNNAQWRKWIEVMNENRGGMTSADFSYLKKCIPDFKDFVDIVKFLQSTTIEGENNKRWSSQFIFPYGPDCLYEDLRVTGTNISNDRRFFGRTGELLYLMISRSNRKKEILVYLKEKILDGKSPFNKLVSKLQPKDEHFEGNRREGGYLPFEKLPEYDLLSEDWINLFNCKMPNFDVFPYLINITGLHLLIYLLNRSKEILRDSKKTTFVLEIISPQKTIVRDLASDSYTENNNRSKQAVEEYVLCLKNSDAWKQIELSDDAYEAAKGLIEKEFNWKDMDKTNSTTPDALLKEFSKSVATRHKQHVQNFHRVWGKEIGLVSKRSSRRLRYAPTDTFLKTLVLSNVESKMEFQEFLECLYEKYGFIIGDRQAGMLFKEGDADQEPFSENAIRLEERLSSMGLLKRLSDACAYVENPYKEEDIR
ncbi:hypothetical protein [Neobacillus sp. PS3-40]|uniref:hypothetical protein n=1 Tax=Neobacillus sp. PS3-40 TaxID=3070679 RepID=UPI0027DEFEB3|nr:hypothetical protein [Neobacillus sp. PS3-40]WML44342.1 hypothetical protein RCG20_21680 [Neobacillus sp. PS3-40]